MKHLSHKVAASLLVTSLTLSSAHADRPLMAQSTLDDIHKFISDDSSSLELPFFDSFDDSLLVPVHKGTQPRYIISESTFRSVCDGEAHLENALLSGSAAQDDVISLTNLYYDLKSQFDALSKETKKLKIENAALKTEQEQHKAEKQSVWKRLKNWIFKLDVTKVATTVISGLISAICTLLVIIL